MKGADRKYNYVENESAVKPVALCVDTRVEGDISQLRLCKTYTLILNISTVQQERSNLYFLKPKPAMCSAKHLPFYKAI